MKNKLISTILSAVIAASLISSVGCMVPLAIENTSSNFYIKHQHVGDSSVFGGCYTVPVYHIHSEAGSGDCYTPRYHQHVGSPNASGGCYAIPVPHHHTGDSSQAGGCYVASYHTHNSSCYNSGTCYLTHGTEYHGYYTDQYCPSHGTVSFVEQLIYYNHDGCGSPTTQEIGVGCPYCSNYGIKSSHEYSYLSCPLSNNSIVGYVLGCNHTEGDVDHFDIGCGKEGVIEGYDLTCPKTSYSIDYYDPGCGIENIAKVTITENKSSEGGSSTLNVDIEDLSGGIAGLDDINYVWSDSEGNEIGQGTSIVVDSDGKYGVSVETSSPYVDASSLNGYIDISIYYPPQNNDENTSSTDHNNGTGNAADKNDNQDNIDGVDKSDEVGDDDNFDETNNNDPFISDAGNTDNISSDNNIISEPVFDDATLADEVENDTESMEGIQRADRLKKGNVDNLSNAAYEISEDDLFNGASENYELEPVREKTDVKVEETFDNNEEIINNATAEETEGNLVRKFGKFLKTTPGKIISISLGSLILMGLLILIGAILRGLVVIYNYDGEMKRHLLGIAHITLKEDGYELVIPKTIVERSYTNRFEFDLRLFLIGRKKDMELLIIKKDKRVSAKVEKLLAVTI